MITQINLTEQSEKLLKTIKQIGFINNIDVSTKEKQINLAIKIAYDCFISVDCDTLQEIANLKKSI